MAEAKPIASLTPALLARKGGARPAIRSQQQDMVANADASDAGDAAADTAGEESRISATARARSKAGNKVVSLSTIRKVAPAGKPQALRHQREQLADRLAGRAKPQVQETAEAAPARLSAFTLRLDADRRLKLRLASAIANRSAQQLLVEALDSMLAALPEVAEMASRAGKQR